MAEIVISYKNKKIKIRVRKTGFLSRGLGLMFKPGGTENLLFEFSRSERTAITSWFVFFPFLAVWLDERNRVLDYMVVLPFQLSVAPSCAFRKLIELPINGKNRRNLAFFVGKRGKV